MKFNMSTDQVNVELQFTKCTKRRKIKNCYFYYFQAEICHSTGGGLPTNVSTNVKWKDAVHQDVCSSFC